MTLYYITYQNAEDNTCVEGFTSKGKRTARIRAIRKAKENRDKVQEGEMTLPITTKGIIIAFEKGAKFVHK